MISVRVQGKPFNITVIQVYSLTSNAEEAEIEWFCEDLQDLLELTPKKRGPFYYRGLEWVGISFSRGSPQPRDQTHISCLVCIGRQILYH